MKTDYKKKFSSNDEKAIEFFIKNGYVCYENIHHKQLVENCKTYFFQKYDILKELSAKGAFKEDTHGWAVAIIDEFSKTHLYEEFITNRRVVKLMKDFLGPDIALLGYDALWLNIPKDTDPVLLKGLHTDSWTGTSVNTIFAKTFFTDVDKFNGMTVCPGSHLQGLVPVRNRSIDPNTNANFEVVNLDNSKIGDFLVWHPLLIHSTTGHSDKNTRISLTSRYTSTETEFSSQERALGYRTLNVGPMNQIRRLIGNDYMTPFRTLGGHVGIDRRLSEIYEYGNYDRNKDYSQYLK